MSVRHLDGGTAACVQLITVTEIDDTGRTVTRQARCICPRFTTDERIF